MINNYKGNKLNTENAGTTFRTASQKKCENYLQNYKDETVNDTFRRVAKHIASAENTEEKRKYWEEQFYDLLTGFKGVSGGRITANAEY